MGKVVEVDLAARYFDNPVFIVGAGSSGSTLLQSLFDFHPHLVVFPVESGYYYMYDRLMARQLLRSYRFKRFWRKNSKFSWMKSQVYDNHKVENKRDFSKVDFKIFDEILAGYDFKKHTRARFYRTLVEAYRVSLGISTSDLKGFVDKTPNHVFHINEIRGDFPQAKFIHILRDPYDNFYSYVKKRGGRSGAGLMESHLEGIIKYSFQAAAENQGRDYRVIRYEDLVVDSEKTMRELAEYVGVDFHEMFLKPTLAGKPWSGNSSVKERFKNISNSRMGQGREELNPKDKKSVKMALSDFAGMFNYNL